MKYADEIGQLNQNLQAFLIKKGAGLPEFYRTIIIEAVASPSPVDRIVKSAEALYAVKDKLDEEGLRVCAQLAQFAALNGWHGMDQDNRGGRIAQAVQRILGDKAPTGEWPISADDPIALFEYQVPVGSDQKALQKPAPLQEAR